MIRNTPLNFRLGVLIANKYVIFYFQYISFIFFCIYPKDTLTGSISALSLAGASKHLPAAALTNTLTTTLALLYLFLFNLFFLKRESANLHYSGYVI